VTPPYAPPDIEGELIAMGVSSHRVVADGLDTHYLEIGQGPTLLLVHGGGAGADSWGNWKGCLHAYARNFRVIAPDMPGFGRTAKPAPADYDYSQPSRNRHMLAFMDALGLDSAHLIGNSMGGATALGVAMQQPERVDKLVLMGSAGLGISNQDPTYMKAFSGYDYTKEAMRRLMQNLGGSRYQIDESLLMYRHSLMQEPAAQAAIDVIRRSHLVYEREQIAAVKTPTLVVGGKDDKIAVLARTYGYLELMDNSWGFVLPHVGHWAMMESPREFVAITTAFFSNDMF